MILKGNARANGQDLASHLLNQRYNESVDFADLRGFAADDLHSAFAEAEAIAQGTNCKKPLFSLSISPSQQMSREQYAHAIEAIEERLGLHEQARAVVFHVKDGREHAHVVWSRINTDRMQAVSDSFYKNKLREVSRQLCRDFGHAIPKGLEKDRGADRFNDLARQETLAQREQEKRTGITKEQRREDITAAYKSADCSRSFCSSLEQRGYVLAKGDKRNFVVIDRQGNTHALGRCLEGVKVKEAQTALRLDTVELPNVIEAKQKIAALQRHGIETGGYDGKADLAKLAEHEKKLKEAQAAEIAAEKARYGNVMTGFREEYSNLWNEVSGEVKEVYKDDWRAMFRRHREELKETKKDLKSPIKKMVWDNPLRNLTGTLKRINDWEHSKGLFKKAFNYLVNGKKEFKEQEKQQEGEKLDFKKRTYYDLKNPIHRLRYMMDNKDYNLFDGLLDENRGHLSRAFVYLDKGQREVAKLEERHKSEREDLSNKQYKTTKSEVIDRRKEVDSRRLKFREDFNESMNRLRGRHKEERDKSRAYVLDEKAKIKSREEAARANTKRSREQSERDGTDQKTETRRARWGFNRTGFQKAGFNRTGFEKGKEEKEREEERERFIKPPGQSFTPD